MPKWIRRWIKRVRDKFPQCAVRYSFNSIYHAYLIEIYYPKEQAWSPTGHWHIWAIQLNPSKMPTVRQNRLSFRDDFDYGLQKEIEQEILGEI